jgi:ferredoxin
MPKFKIVHHRKKCIGCGVCVAVCPDNWKMQKDGKASPLTTELVALGNNEKAAQACPVKIIKIKKQ